MPRHLLILWFIVCSETKFTLNRDLWQILFIIVLKKLNFDTMTKIWPWFSLIKLTMFLYLLSMICLVCVCCACYQANKYLLVQQFKLIVYTLIQNLNIGAELQPSLPWLTGSFFLAFFLKCLVWSTIEGSTQVLTLDWLNTGGVIDCIGWLQK